MTLPLALPPTHAAQFFDAIAPRYDSIYAPARDESRARLARVLRELPDRARVLDLGVGTGRELPALLDAGHSPVGLDVSGEMLAIARRRRRPIPLVRGDLWQRLPWDEASFDAVLALHGTLCHPPSASARRAFPGEVARVLRPRGVFVAEVPSVTWLERAHAAAIPGLVRVADDRARFIDERTGAAIEAWFLSAEDWHEVFATALTVRIDAVDETDLLIVGHRAA